MTAPLPPHRQPTCLPWSNTGTAMAWFLANSRDGSRFAWPTPAFRSSPTVLGCLHGAVRRFKSSRRRPRQSHVDR